MTENEAIVNFKQELKEPLSPFSITMCSMAIQALEKVQAFESIGTIEELQALKEKNVAKKAKWIFDDFTATFGNPYLCSNCDEEFGDTYNYCPNCGCSMYD